MLKVTILGCGSSLGVPVIGCKCHVCKSKLPYNKRTRSATFIDCDGTKILIDFGFEIRQQLIDAEITTLDAAILTHDHADHVSGIDNLRAFYINHKKALNLYTDTETAFRVEKEYQYLFQGFLKMNPINFFELVTIGNAKIQFFRQHHSNIGSLGIRTGGLVYSSDVSDFPDESRQYLQNIEIWVLDCFGYGSDNNHAGLDKVLQWNQQFFPKKILLTNMRHEIDYYNIIAELPPNIIPLYDGYTFEL
ncbi:MAG: MBL fold metallo-hydrolase [Janthinobacterium lividum]